MNVLSKRIALLLPLEVKDLLHIGMKTEMNGAGDRDALKGFAMLVCLRQRHGDLNGKAGDTARGRLAHLLFDNDLHPAEINLVPRGEYPHRGCDAGSQTGCDKIRRGEAFAFSLIVHRRIGDECFSRSDMGRLAAQGAVVADVYLDKVCSHDEELNDSGAGCEQHLVHGRIHGVVVTSGVLLPARTELLEVIIWKPLWAG